MTSRRAFLAGGAAATAGAALATSAPAPAAASGAATEQHDVFGALREVKRGRADVTPRLMQHLESSLARLDEANPSRGLQTPPTRKAGA